MKNKSFEVSDEAAVTIPIRNLVAMIFATGVVVMGYFELTERISILERELTLAEQYIHQNSEFRIKWPRGELGALPDDMIQNAELETLKNAVELNTQFRTTWEPPPEVQQSVRINNEQEVRLKYIEQRIESLENSINGSFQISKSSRN